MSTSTRLHDDRPQKTFVSEESLAPVWCRTPIPRSYSLQPRQLAGSSVLLYTQTYCVSPSLYKHRHRCAALQWGAGDMAVTGLPPQVTL
jgi:hypothetical protein